MQLGLEGLHEDGQRTVLPSSVLRGASDTAQVQYLHAAASLLVLWKFLSVSMAYLKISRQFVTIRRAPQPILVVRLGEDCV